MYVRKREILSLPVENGNACPHLEEKKASNQSLVCNARYSMKTGSWGNVNCWTPKNQINVGVEP